MKLTYRTMIEMRTAVLQEPGRDRAGDAGADHGAWLAGRGEHSAAHDYGRYRDGDEAV